MSVATARSPRTALLLSDLPFLLSLVFLTGNAGYFARNIDRCCGVLLLFFFATFELTIAGRRGRSFFLGAVVTAVTLSAALLLPRHIAPIATVGLPLFLIDRARPNVLDDRRRVRLSTVAGIFILILSGVRFSPEIAYVWEKLVALINIPIAKAIGERRALGPTLIGLPSLVLGVIHAIVRGRECGRRRIVAVTVGLVAVIFAWGAFQYATERTRDVLDSIYGREIGIHRVLIFVMQESILMPFSVFLRKNFIFLQPVLAILLQWPFGAFGERSMETAPLAEVYRRRSGIAVASLFAVASALSVLWIPGKSSAGRILIAEKGRYDVISPNFESFGGMSSGMFGMLDRSLNTLGFAARRAPVTAENLAETDVLCLINVSEPFTDDEHRNIESFVRGGGTLLCLGDHTRFETDDPYHRLLEPTGIRYRFDTAQPFEMGWPECLEFAPGVYPRTQERSYSVHHWVGATLETEPHVRRLLVGRYGFADYGNETDIAMNKLGNRRADPGEAIGDLCLIAEDRMGDGRVVVYGDTTTFQNRQIVHTWTHVQDVFANLTGPRQYRAPTILGALAFAAAGVLAAATAKRLPQWTIPSAAAACVLIGMAAQFEADVTFRRPSINRTKAAAPVALLDCTHGQRVSVVSSEPDAVDGMALNAMRNGYVTLLVERDLIETIESADLVICPAPTRAYDESELMALEKFVARGGRLLLTIGRPDVRVADSLLDRFGFEVGDVPLGGAEVEPDQRSIALNASWPLVDKKGGAETLIGRFDRPIAMKRPIGDGFVVLVADSGFLLGKTLEESGHSTADGYAFRMSLPNVRFLETIFRRS